MSLQREGANNSTDLYRTYVRANRARAARNLLWLGILVQIGLFFTFDIFATHWSRIYIEARLWLVVGDLVFIFLLKWVASSVWKERAAFASLLGASLWLEGWYVYLHAWGPAEYEPLYLLAHMMVISFQTIYLHRYVYEQVLFNVIGILGLVVVSAMKPELFNHLLLLMIAHGVTFGITFFMRQEFKGSLLERMSSLSLMLPKNKAELIVMSDDAKAFASAFHPRKRYSVCICLDWRNFQKVMRSASDEEMSKNFEVFYEAALRILEERIPDGQFFADWSADELFITIFDENDRRDLVHERSLGVALQFSRNLIWEVQSRMSFPLRFDIGMASGVGLLGLQGPRGGKKTTITAEHAGLAKRFESQAAELRKKSGLDPVEPIIVMDEVISAFGEQRGLLDSGYLKAIVPSLKDIDPDRRLKCYSAVIALGRESLRIARFEQAGESKGSKSGSGHAKDSSKKSE